MRNTITSLLLLLLSSTLATAKSPTVKLTITGGGLEQPLDVVDPEVLEQSQIWAGNFLDRTQDVLKKNPGSDTPYEISFFIRSGSGAMARRYVVYYHPQPSTQGYLYLPGRGEPWYRLNVSAILRGNRDGSWNHAAPTWERLIKLLIARAETRSHK
jgi:hypothetical protein